MRNIDWNSVLARYDAALEVAAPARLVQPQFADVPAVSVEEVAQMLRDGAAVQIIDTRPRHYTTRSPDMMAGAVWRDPERIGEWMGELSKTEPVITFCVYGFHIGCESAATLRKAGFDARYMAGGHAGWKAAKGPVKLLEQGRET
jgi:Fe-Mn family superoxide dismutase